MSPATESVKSVSALAAVKPPEPEHAQGMIKLMCGCPSGHTNVQGTAIIRGSTCAFGVQGWRAAATLPQRWGLGW